MAPGCGITMWVQEFADWSPRMPRDRATPETEPKELAEVSDEDLAQLLATPPAPSAFSELVRRYQTFSYRVAFSVCGDAQLAEESVQEVFVRMLNRQCSFTAQGPGSFRKWLYAVVHTVARNHLRTERRTVKRPQQRRYREEAAGDAAPPVGSECEQQEMRGAALEALGALEEDVRLPIVLHFLEALSQAEVGRILGISQQLVSQRISKGLDAMRHRLAQGGVTLSVVALPDLISSGLLNAPPTLQQSLAELCTAAQKGAGIPGAMAGHTARSTRLASPGWLSPLAFGVGVAVLGLAAGVIWISTRSPGEPKDAQAPQGVARTGQPALEPDSGSTGEAAADAFPARKWSFAKGPAADLQVMRGRWEWRPGKTAANGTMHCDGYVMLLLPDEVPAEPFAVIIKSSAIEEIQINFDGLWTDGTTVLANRLWLAKSAPTLNKSLRDQITFRQVFWQRYVLTYIDRTLCGIREFPSSYPAKRVAIALAIPAVTSLEIVPLEDGKLPKECQTIDSVRRAMKGPTENPEEALKKPARPTP